MLCKQPFVRETNYRSGKSSAPHRCGRCLHCRIAKAREWQFRLIFEHSVSADSEFVTLTYDEENYPEGGQLVKSHLQDFIKKYRHEVIGKLRYFAVGEYGDHTWRPHYHVAMFTNGQLCRNSIESKWGKGFTSNYPLETGRIKYITGYVAKKVRKNYYERLGNRPPEFMTCSKMKGGIGHERTRRIGESLKESGYYNGDYIDELSLAGRKIPVGRYLGNILNQACDADPKSKVLKYHQRLQDLNSQFGLNDRFLHELLEHFESKRESQETKSKIFKKRTIV